MAEQEQEDEAQATRPKAPLWRKAMAGLVVLVGVGLFLMVVAGFLGRWAWWLDLLAHFRPLLVAGLVVTALAQMLVGSRRWAIAWGTGAILAAVPMWGLYFGSHAEGPPTLRVGHLNVGDAPDFDAIAAWAEAAEVDVLSLQEINSENLPRLAAALEGYRRLVVYPRGDTRGVAAFVRNELSGVRVVRARTIEPTPDSDRPMVELLVMMPQGVALAILGFHTTRPTGADVWEWQRQGMRGAATWVNEQASAAGAGRDVLVIGDFNSTSQGVLVRSLMKEAGLRDARAGFGWQGTWPAEKPAAVRLPIDGAYVSGGVAVVGLEVGPNIGSDHLPLVVSVRERTTQGE